MPNVEKALELLDRARELAVMAMDAAMSIEENSGQPNPLMGRVDTIRGKIDAARDALRQE